MLNRMVILLLTLCLLVAGCMGAPENGTEHDDEGDAEGLGTDQEITPDPVSLEVRTTGTYPLNPGFSPERLEVVTGAPVTVTLFNDDLIVSHAWRVEGIDGSGSDTIGPEAQAQTEFIAPEPGEYVFYCPVGNHRQLGQEGVFVVTAG